MTTAKIFKNGKSQAVRLPKEFRFEEKEVAINMVGNVVMLMPKSNPWAGFLSSLELFSDDFMSDGRSENSIQIQVELDSESSNGRARGSSQEVYAGYEYLH